MIDIGLTPGEVILLQTSEAEIYSTSGEKCLSELYLTNQNLICVYEKETSFFSDSQYEVERMPLNTIGMANGIPQIKIVDDEEYGKTIQIVYKSGNRILLELYESPRKQYPIWVDEISKAVKSTFVTPPPIPDDVKTEPRVKSFCSYCGTKLDHGARFCKNCGKTVDGIISGSAATTIPKPEEIPIKENPTTRKTVFEGTIHKCPSCGEVLKSFQATCPACGHEFRDSQASSTVRELARKLELIESRKMPEVNDTSFMKKVFGRDFKKEEEEDEARSRFEHQKESEMASLIINYAIPNTREDVLEFMLLASSNINLKDKTQSEVTKAWIQKLEQVYKRAELIMGKSEEFSQIKAIYDDKKKQIKTKKIKSILGVCGLIFLYLFLMGMLWNPTATICIVIGLSVLGIAGFILFKKR